LDDDPCQRGLKISLLYANVHNNKELKKREQQYKRVIPKTEASAWAIHCFVKNIPPVEVAIAASAN
jgi:hypothetical protein